MKPIELVSAFLTYKHTNRGRSPRTVEIYRLALERFLEFLGDRDPREASFEELVAFTGPWLAKRGLGARARRPNVSAVKEFFRWMQRAGHIRESAAELLQHPSYPRTLPNALRLANAEKLIYAPDYDTFTGVRDGAILALLFGCGMRVTALVRLNRSSVIEERIDGRPRLVLKVRDKGDKERMIPVPQEADLMLRVYLEHPQLKEIDAAIAAGDHVLFVSTMNRNVPAADYRGDRRRMTRWSVHQMMVTYGKRLGIPISQLHPHAARHLYGTELTESNVPLLVVQQLMGHEDPKSTEIYTSVALRKLVREVDHATPLAKIKTPVSDLLGRLQPAARPPR